MMRMLRIVVWEFLLLFASILVFRSVWTFLAKIPFLETSSGYWASLILGTIVALISIFMINNHAGKIEKIFFQDSICSKSLIQKPSNMSILDKISSNTTQNQ